jgi:integrase
MLARRRALGVTLQSIRGRLYVAIHRARQPVERIPVGPDTPENRGIGERAAEKIRERMLVAQIRGNAACPTLAEFSRRYLAEDTNYLAETTRRDRPSYLRAGGVLLGPLGSVPLDEITPQTLRTWWAEQIEGPGRSVGTGRHYLDVLSAVLGYAVDLGILGANPVPTFREMLRRMMRNKRGRALADPSGRKRPLERPEEIDALVQAAAAEGAREFVLVLFGVDAGLRYGEMLGVRWGLVSWGSRSLHLDETSNRPRGWNPTEPKSGRIRDVALSRRLLAALSDLYEVRFHPSPDALILEGTDAANFRKRAWRRICERAGLGHRSIKDLRDTYASQLLMAGISIGYISRQLGHAGTQITSEHYAKWLSEDYVEPMALEPGEVPADLLARLSFRQLRQSASTGRDRNENASAVSQRRRYGILERETGVEPATLSLGS